MDDAVVMYKGDAASRKAALQAYQCNVFLSVCPHFATSSAIPFITPVLIQPLLAVCTCFVHVIARTKDNMIVECHLLVAMQHVSQRASQVSVVSLDE